MTVDLEPRKQIVCADAADGLRQLLYTQLVNEQYIDAHTKMWTGMNANLNAYSKKYYTDPTRRDSASEPGGGTAPPWVRSTTSSSGSCSRCDDLRRDHLNFVLFRGVPGDAVVRAAVPSVHGGVQEIQRQELGLDKPLVEQYWLYLNNLTHGDMGSSLRTEQPVLNELWEPIKNTMPMVALGTLFSIILRDVAGVISAWSATPSWTRTGLYTALGFYSMPTHG